MSRVNFGAKPNMYPLPVLIIATYDKDGNPDAMNAACGVVTDFNEISISMGDHKTTDNLAATGAFTVSMATEDTVVGCDYVGIESGRKVPDKFARAGFHATKSEFVNAPLIDELPMALECKVKSFDNGRRERSDRRKDRPEKTETNRLRPGQQHLSRHGRQSRRRIRFRKSPEINTDDDMIANM